MDPISNPYSPGAGKRPPALVGRDDHTEAFDVAVRRLARRSVGPEPDAHGLARCGQGPCCCASSVMSLLDTAGSVRASKPARTAPSCARSRPLLKAPLLDLTPGRRLSQIASRVLGVLKSFQLSWDIPEAGHAHPRRGPGRRPGRLAHPSEGLDRSAARGGPARQGPRQGRRRHDRRDPAPAPSST